MAALRSWSTVVCLALVAGACSSGGSSGDASGSTTTDTGEPNQPAPESQPSIADPPATVVATIAEDPVPPAAGECDAADAVACLLPWPNDRFTRPDAATPTGLRIDLPADGMPSNADGTPIGVDEWNRNDGFSPASMPMTVIPNLDPVASSLPPVTDIGMSLRGGSSLLLIDTETGDRLAAWAEMDSDGVDPSRTPLIVVPAAALAEEHEHLVVLRNLIDIDGAEMATNQMFAQRMAAPENQQDADLRAALEAADLRPEDLYLAWTFTVASADSLSGRLRHMWSETSSELAEGAPEFVVTSVEPAGAANVVRGTFEMPNYLIGDGSTGSYFNNEGDPNGIPSRNGSMTTDFTCMVPLSARGEAPAPFVLYGHGLLGDREQVLGIGASGASVGIGFCAIDFIGMSTNDVPTVVAALQDLTAFKAQPDRLQQGHLAWLLLGRLLASEEGFATDAAFQDPNGVGVVAHDRLAFLGASQGGILGGASTALSSDLGQVILAVPGIGYNLLLPRSIDFDEFSSVFEDSYPDPLDRSIVRELMEMLWDRGENAGWAQHLTAAPYDGAQEKNVLILAAFGDHQVANVSTDKLARTLGTPIRTPALADGRSSDVEPFFGIEAITDVPHHGSGYIMWDFGTPTPPIENVPPRAGDDPHGKLGDVQAALLIVLNFIEPDGPVIDPCGEQPCQTLE